MSHVVVIGGGVSGLAAALGIKRSLPDVRVTVLEGEAEPGGCARSDRRDGYVIDRGPNGFLTNTHETHELAREIGLADELTPATDAAQKRLLWFDGALREAPTGPAAFLASEMLSPLGKARVALEPFVGRAPAGSDETVFDFAARRLGREFADAFVAPLVLGIAAGDARAISLRAQFPRLARLEDEYGGLLRGMLARRREARREPTRTVGGPAGPGGRLTTFRGGGVERLIEALRDELGAIVRTSATVTALSRESHAAPWTIGLQDGSTFEADRVILATPSFVTARLLEAVAPSAAADLNAIPYAGVRVLGLGYDRIDVPHPLDGFGFLVPRGHGVRILGCLWTSTLFPWQAPEGKVLLRIIAGGTVDPGFTNLSDDDALRVARADLERTMGIVAEPEMIHHVRWENAIPQYPPGHQNRVARIMHEIAATPGLHLTGAAYHGTGLNDCVGDAARVAREVADALAPVP